MDILIDEQGLPGFINQELFAKIGSDDCVTLIVRRLDNSSETSIHVLKEDLVRLGLAARDTIKQ